ncbi:hypothetical protein BX600DRAFT_504362 [Xylariales sp. PMI_506]|nr:hypothetical protein BX600DRAFT_504362 [Xylariales sp. PMI_506]
MIRSTAVAILSLAASAFAGTIPAVIGVEGNVLGPNVVLVGAANATIASSRHAKAAAVTASPRLVPRIASPPEYLTITLINSHGSPISTSHFHSGTIAAVSGNVGPATMANGATAAFAVPTGWIGTVTVADAEHELSDDASLIESNFIITPGYTIAIADVDVSYVNGFTMAVTCSCSGVGVLTGCNKNLWALATCPADDDNTAEGACINPYRANTDTTVATAFFAPCSGAAFTFPDDYGADPSWGQCQSGQITCCVGPTCPANPNQPA